MDWSAALLALAGLLAVVGLIGTLHPVFPGVPILFAGLLLASFAEDFAHVGPGWLAVIGVIALLTFGVDFVAGALGAKRFGASRQALVGASVGALVGLFFGLPGILLGPFVGAAVGELVARRDLVQAGRAGIGATLGLALGVAAKLGLSLAMVGVYLVLRLS